MKSYCFVLGILALVFASLAFADAADDQKERDRLGLTQEEWETCKVLNLSPAKVRELLSSGITIEEYAGSPWLSSGISEQQWITLRRQGMKDLDIRQMNKVDAEPPEKAGKLIVGSFFLPGYGHHKMGKNRHALTFAGISVTSAALFVFHRKTVSFRGETEDHQFRFSYFALWLTNSVVCAADVWRRSQFDDNPDLERFSFWTGPQEAGISANFRF